MNPASLRHREPHGELVRAQRRAPQSAGGARAPALPACVGREPGPVTQSAAQHHPRRTLRRAAASPRAHEAYLCPLHRGQARRTGQAPAPGRAPQRAARGTCRGSRARTGSRGSHGDSAGAARGGAWRGSNPCASARPEDTPLTARDGLLLRPPLSVAPPLAAGAGPRERRRGRGALPGGACSGGRTEPAAPRGWRLEEAHIRACMRSHARDPREPHHAADRTHAVRPRVARAQPGLQAAARGARRGPAWAVACRPRRSGGVRGRGGQAHARAHGPRVGHGAPVAAGTRAGARDVGPG